MSAASPHTALHFDPNLELNQRRVESPATYSIEAVLDNMGDLLIV